MKAKILPIVKAPHPLLKQKSKPVEKVNDEIISLMNDMLQTMYSEEGIGLAAVQVGHLKRILVIDLDYESHDHHHHHHHGEDGCSGVHVKNTNPRYFINPEILQISKEFSSYNEGCLSFPGARAEVERPTQVTVKFIDYDGSEKTEEMTGLLAVCIQHEIDHLNGITFVDHISKLKRDMILKRMNKN